MEASDSSHTSAHLYTTRHHIPGDIDLHIHRHHNLKNKHCVFVCVIFSVQKHISLHIFAHILHADIEGGSYKAINVTINYRLPGVRDSYTASADAQLRVNTSCQRTF